MRIVLEVDCKPGLLKAKGVAPATPRAQAGVPVPLGNPKGLVAGEEKKEKGEESRRRRGGPKRIGRRD